ncbi:hypothetical protein ACHAXR_005858 [Thalassiosira sp. AJA248-18]
MTSIGANKPLHNRRRGHRHDTKSGSSVRSVFGRAFPIRDVFKRNRHHPPPNEEANERALAPEASRADTSRFTKIIPRKPPTRLRSTVNDVGGMTEEDRESTRRLLGPKSQSASKLVDSSHNSQGGEGDAEDMLMPLGTERGVKTEKSVTPLSGRKLIAHKNAMSRRARNTFRASSETSHGGQNMQVVKQLRATLKSRKGRCSSKLELLQEPLSCVILNSLRNERLCDVEIIGNDDVPVQAPSYLLAAHSEVFEAMFYSQGQRLNSNDQFFDCPDESNVETANLAETTPGGGIIEGGESSARHQVELAFADYDAIQASVEFLATRSLPEHLEEEANEFIIRSICRIHLIGMVFKISPLMNQADRMARRIMNKKPELVCAAFDECIVSAELVSPKYKKSSWLDEMKEYALDYMRESPLTTLLSKGTMFLTDKSIKAVICDQDMDVDEHTMFHILNTWVKQDEDNMETGKALVSNIRLSYIKADYLNNVVRKCGFVDSSDVQAALKKIEEVLANRSPDEQEHVLVEGAGNDEINGIYVRMDEDIGLGEEEVMYVKESQEDDFGPDYGLYLLRSTWSITSCIDYSNILYSCEASDNSTSLRHQAPEWGWAAVGANEPPPTCTWHPSKESMKAAGVRGYVAPNLADAGANNKNLGDIANGDHDEGRKRYTLRTMLNLPIDEDYVDGDYHDDVDDSEASRDIGVIPV